MFMHGIVHLILNGSKEHLRHLGPWVIISRCCIDVRHLLIEVTLAAADVADALQEFLEVSIAPLLQPLIIHSESFFDVFVQPLSSPTAESHSNRRLHPVAKGYYHIQIVMVNLPLHLSLALLTN